MGVLHSTGLQNPSIVRCQIHKRWGRLKAEESAGASRRG